MKFKYQSYMLRLWPYQEDGKTYWSASLQMPGSDEKHDFSSIDKLFTFIQAQTGYAHSVHNFIDRENGQTNIEISIRIQQTSSGDEDEN